MEKFLPVRKWSRIICQRGYWVNIWQVIVSIIDSTLINIFLCNITMGVVKLQNYTLSVSQIGLTLTFKCAVQTGQHVLTCWPVWIEHHMLTNWIAHHFCIFYLVFAITY